MIAVAHVLDDTESHIQLCRPRTIQIHIQQCLVQDTSPVLRTMLLELNELDSEFYRHILVQLLVINVVLLLHLFSI